MKTKSLELVEGLSLSIDNQEIGVISHYSGGKNILAFSPDYVALPAEKRNTFTMSQLVNERALRKPLISSQRLPPVLSNLLPEGALRQWMAQALKVHQDNEFPLMAHMGRSLPGGLIASPIVAGQLPVWALDHREQVEAIQIDVATQQNKFSLAGVQMKFSSVRNKDGRFNIGTDANDDSWIIKIPSTVHPFVPFNEFSAMRLAEAVGVDIPEIKLVKLSKLDNLPNIQLPNEEYAYAIKRFDRDNGKRVHTEDFAQIFQVYSHEKYEKYNYEQIADALYSYSHQGLKDVQQLARRILVNILLANGDAHLKNWSVIYSNPQRPMLSPAYDIVSTIPYVKGESEFALNMAKNKNWYDVSMASFEIWSNRVGFPWQAVKVHITDTLDKARSVWPKLLTELPMHREHKQVLRHHWSKLHEDFRL
ncbi:serine/threonine-protein kinase HipA [Idiomarina loihiensis]|uniref:type II toxin-antitoxin system HipA family toxin n=1 Tax=Idiomarina TaxID=135575 RepID=UPI000D7128A0|nr:MULTISPECIES: type II toxin-antitoxin system HipA family toxin [Idiomarina]PWW37006.1 serine/threonine-protein kinase HipA [Idiomarina loihiensis]TDP46814.1 serine/threonine-protein kinase HipA [Idiomarina loihiensis]TDS23085.1 serine/threonine-protein kinase HipA [Idiomarina sp. H2]